MEYEKIVLEFGEVVILTPTTVLKLIRLKWDCIVENDGSDIGIVKKFPILREFKFLCALCNLFFSLDAPWCSPCPSGALKICGGGKGINTPAYRHFKYGTKDTAIVIRDLIYKVTVDDVRKAMEAQENEKNIN